MAELAVEGVDLHYGAAQVLWDVDLEVRAGEITCLLGRNGVGKTSLLRAVTGQHPVSRGDIRLDGTALTRLAAHARARRGIALVPQGREIFPLLTVKENLETGLGVRPPGETVPDEVFELFPVLQEMLGRRGGDLSGGQQQQLAIARALVMAPKVLVLDEPTEGIQPSIIQEIERVIGLLRDRGDMAILLVEQYFEFAQALADRIAVMDRGRIVLWGRKDEVDEEAVRARLTV
jgi:urea transport system ATP-binding protein